MRREWKFTNKDISHGVFLLIHGLNNNPSVMDPQLALVNELGFHALVLTLTAHEKNDHESKHSASKDAWLLDLDQALTEVAAKYPDAALYNLSYSMGCTIALNYIAEKQKNPFKKLIFFGPAICLSPFSNLMRLLTPFRFLKFSVPSAIPEGLYAHKMTSIYSLKGLQDLLAGLNGFSNSPCAKNSSALIFSSPKDKLLDHKKLLHWIEKNNLINWKMMEVIPKKGVHFSDHLFLGEDQIEQPEFSEVRRAIKEFLEV